VRESEEIAERRDVARNASRLGLALDPFEVAGKDDAKAHAPSLSVAPTRVG
jgi:hypothetical protein